MRHSHSFSGYCHMWMWGLVLVQSSCWYPEPRKIPTVSPDNAVGKPALFLLTWDDEIPYCINQGEWGTSLATQWLRLCAVNTGGIPDWEIRTLHMAWPKDKKHIFKNQGDWSFSVIGHLKHYNISKLSHIPLQALISSCIKYKTWIRWLLKLFPLLAFMILMTLSPRSAMWLLIMAEGLYMSKKLKHW